ncbi:MAG: bifunctional riboflavin kinase/FAD synthetase [Bacteroidales bacterium]|nr:bifunctional riboflavin kinase/FAD synthetase [Bacteroidales bacterium]
MIIVQKPEQTKGREIAITIGFFDGLHAGHRALIREVLKAAELMNLGSAVVTFWPHPRLVLKKDPEKLRFLTTLNEKSKIVSKSGVDFLIVQEFTPQYFNLEPADFIDYLVNNYHVKHIVVGADHRFGKDGKGNADLLKQLGAEKGFSVQIIDQLVIDNTDISSTKIREALLKGNIERANQMLGYPYLITGAVESGNQLGRKLGFPTANIRPNDPLKLIPLEGVYAAIVSINGEIKQGMLNIGFRPTVENSRRQTIEVHIFDFEQEIYNSGIEVALIKRLRNEKRFQSIDLLQAQLLQDKTLAIEALKDQDINSFQNLFLTLRSTK